MACLAVVAFLAVGCGADEPPKATPASPATPDVRAPDAEVTRAAEAFWKAVDDYDVKAFAAACVERAGSEVRPLAPTKEVEASLTDLHQKYGARARTLTLEPAAGQGGAVVVDTIFGEREDAVALTLTRAGTAWKVSLISSADPAAVGR